ILKRLMGDDDFDQTVATIGFDMRELEYGRSTFSLWDVGGQSGVRPMWKHYFIGTHAIIFVVDAADDKRFPEAKAELQRLAADVELRG
ncbi:small GTPase superfamily, ARF type, partial [Kipferlia bialata]